jgi:outer membrane receptor protein involved in Fe transport
LLLVTGAGNVEASPDLSRPIPPQPLAAALTEFARQTRLQLVYLSTIVGSRTSKEVPAGLAPANALGRLLDESGLTFEFLNPRTVRIFEALAAAPVVPPGAAGAPLKRGDNLSISATRPGDAGVLEDVVITAQRRSESISKVPMSISALSASDLEHEQLANFADLSQSVPNVSFTTQGGAGLSTLEIRGVSSQAGTAAIGVYLNDVSLTTRNLFSQGTAEPRVFDLDRVEVLRGPQGTLYGGGTLGGVIRFIDKQPNLQQFEASATAGLSETRHGGANYDVEGVLNLPILDGTLALRLGVQEGHDSGYIDQISPGNVSVIAKGINGNRWTVVKAALKWHIDDVWSATPAIFYQKFESYDIDTFFEVVPYNQPSAGQTLPPLQTTKTVREPGTDRITIPSLTVEGDLGFGDLTIVGSRYDRDFARIQDNTIDTVPYLASLFPAGSAAAAGITALNAAIEETTHQTQDSIEARLASKPYSPDNSLPLTWLAGAFYLNETTELTGTQPVIGIFQLFNQLGLNINDPSVFFHSFPGAWSASDSSLDGHRSYHPEQRAVFGELTYYARDNIRMTLGLRYESAKEMFERDANYYTTGCGRPDLLGDTPACPLQYRPQAVSFSATTPRAVLAWDLSESTLVYGSVAKGYREGSFNRPIPIRLVQVADLQSLGLCDGTPAKCSAAVPSVFQPDSLWSYEIGSKFRTFDNRLLVDASVFFLKWNDTQQDIVLPQSGYDFESNIGHVESYGVELDAKGQPTPGLILRLTCGYNHAIFSDDVPLLGNHSATLNVTNGSRVPGVPDFNALLGVEYTGRYFGSAEVFVRGEVRAVGQSRGTFVAGAPDYYRPAYVTSDGSVGLASGAFEVSMFAKNLNNNRTVLQRPAIESISEAYTLRPRTIGLTFKYRFANM